MQNKQDTSWLKKILLRTTVMIPPKHLDRSWRLYLSNKLDDMYLHSCLPYCGFITKIDNIHQQKDSSVIVDRTTRGSVVREKDLVISSTKGDVKCIVDFCVWAIVPQRGVCMEAKIGLITMHGIVFHHPYMNIIVPSRYLKSQGYEYKTSFSGANFVHDGGSLHNPTPTPMTSFSIGNKLPVVLVHVRFDKSRFYAIARLFMKD